MILTGSTNDKYQNTDYGSEHFQLVGRHHEKVQRREYDVREEFWPPATPRRTKLSGIRHRGA